MSYRSFWISLIILAATACNHKNEKTADTDHEEVKVQYTAYSEHFELFAEADPFVAGQASNVLSHFTLLPGFKPLPGGTVTLRLIINGSSTEQILQSTGRKGIYSFDIKPAMSGEGTMEYLVKTDSATYRMVVPGVKVYPGTQEAIAAAERELIPKTNTTVFTKEQSWKVGFATGYPERKQFGQIIKTTAQVMPAQTDEVLVTARIGGIVSFQSTGIVEGIKVSEGQKLLNIRGNGLADNNSAVRFAEAKNNFEKAQSDFERVSLLAADKIVSEKQLLEAKTTYENTKTVFDNLKQNFNPDGQVVTSPMPGFIKQVLVKNGQYAEAGQPLIIISQNKALLLQAEVQQKYAPLLNSLSDANIRTAGDNMTYSLKDLGGRIVSTGKTTTPDNYLVTVTLEINNPGNFIPGSFVELYLKTVTNYMALTIPNTAIIEEQGNYFVFVQVNPELFEKREIKTGDTDGNETEVTAGISDGERIVTLGAILIKLSQATGALDPHAGHVH